MKKVLVVLGPTATGKTDLALFLAKKYNGELISCDSRQVYKNLDIGTGKMPGQDLRFGPEDHRPLVDKKYDLRWEIGGINVWMYDVADPKDQYSVYDYVKQATIVVEDILKRGKLPIIVGGTGLYLRGLIYGIPNLSIPVDKKLRRDLEKLSLEELQNRLQFLSPIKWQNLTDSDKKNPRRLTRSIELVTMNPYINTQDNCDGLINKYKILKIGLHSPRQILNDRIDSRLISRIDQGLIKEGEDLLEKGLSLKRMKKLGLEYGILADLLAKKITREEFVKILQNKIHQYAKRQMTWFKKEKDIKWFDITLPDMPGKVEKSVSSWYHVGND